MNISSYERQQQIGLAHQGVILGISLNTLNEWVDNGVPRTRTAGDRVLVDRDTVETLLDTVEDIREV